MSMNIIRAGKPQEPKTPVWQLLGCGILSVGGLSLIAIILGSVLMQGMENHALQEETTDITLRNIEGAVIQEARVSEDREQIVLVVQTPHGTTQAVTFGNTFPLDATMSDPETPEWE